MNEKLKMPSNYICGLPQLIARDNFWRNKLTSWEERNSANKNKQIKLFYHSAPTSLHFRLTALFSKVTECHIFHFSICNYRLMISFSRYLTGQQVLQNRHYTDSPFLFKKHVCNAFPWCPVSGQVAHWLIRSISNEWFVCMIFLRTQINGIGQIFY